jgi:hypothetical protein
MSKRIVNNIGIRVRQYFELVSQLREEVRRLVVENNRLSRELTAEKEAHAVTTARYLKRIELAAYCFDEDGEQR